MTSQVTGTASAEQKKKVLLVITKSNWGGAQRSVYDLAVNLPRERFEVAVALGGTGLPSAPTGALAVKLEAAGIRTIFIHSFARDIFLTNDVRALVELWRMFRRERPDIVHLNSSKAGGVGALAARLAGVPRIIFTVHGLPHTEPWRSLPARALIWLATWATFILCHRIIALFRSDLAHIRRMPFCAKKATLVYNGIAPTDVLPRTSARANLAAWTNISLSDTSPLIGTIAEFTRNKGLTFLVEAMADVVQKFPDAKLIIIGSGEEQKPLQALIEEKNLAGKISLTGFIPDASRLLPAFDMFVLPSLKEGWPYVLLEAGLAELPVIATRVGGIPEMIEDETSGLLVKPGDASGLSEKIERLIEHPALRVTLAHHLHQKITAQFSLEQMVEETVKTYKLAH